MRVVGNPILSRLTRTLSRLFALDIMLKLVRQIIRWSKKSRNELINLISRFFPLSTLPERASLKIIRLLSMWFIPRSNINRVIDIVINHFPVIKAKLKRLGYGKGQPVSEEDSLMSLQVRAIYLDLVDSIKKQRHT